MKTYIYNIKEVIKFLLDNNNMMLLVDNIDDYNRNLNYILKEKFLI